MIRKRRILLSSSCFAVLLSGQSAASADVVTYSYDALGRLVASTTAGGPNNSVGTAICFDPAGNRTRYTVGAGVASCGTGSTPTPTPTPTPTNQPPVAVADSASGRCNMVASYNVVANDYDPDGNMPLSLVSVNSTGSVDAVVVSITTIQFIGSVIGTEILSYVVQDSLGATATGTINYHTTGQQSTCYQ